MGGLPGLPEPGFSAAIQPSRGGLPGLPAPGFSSVAAETVAAPAPSVSGYDRLMGGLKGIAEAGSDVVTAPADLLFRGGNAAIDAITGEQTDLTGWYPSDLRNQFLNFMSGGEGDKTTEDVTHLAGNVATVIAAPSQAKNIAARIPVLSKLAASDGAGSTLANLLTKAIGYGTEGAGYSALFNPKSETLGDDMAQGAVLNIAIPAAFKTVGGLARGLSSTAESAAAKLELSAFGANKTRIAKAYEKSPEVLNEMGKQENPLSLAITAFRKDGGGKASMEGETLLRELGKQSGKYIGELSDELAKASAKQTDAIVPEFKFAQNYIDTLPGAVKEEAQAIADDLITKTVNNTDGTLSSLQAEKTGLSPIIKESAYGSNANPLRTNILKYIKGDLRRTIEEGYEKVTGKSAANIKRLNTEIGYRENLEPLFEDIRNTGDARDPLKWLIQNWRTSGGFGAATLLAGQSIGAPAAIIPLVGAAAMTPAGRKAISAGLRSGLVQAPLSVTSKAANVLALTGRAATALADDSYASQRPNNSTQKQSEQPKVESSINPRPISASTQAEFSPMVTGPSEPSQLLTLLSRTTGRDMQLKEVKQLISRDPVDATIMEMESGGDPKAKNPDSSASGLFQLLKKTAKALGVKDVFDPEENYKGYLKLKEEAAPFVEQPEDYYAYHYLGGGTYRAWKAGRELTAEQQAQVKELVSELLPRFRAIYAQKSGMVEA